MEAKDQQAPGSRTNFLRRKANMSVAMPTLVTLYMLGACIASMVGTRTFISFHVDESQVSAELPGQKESPSALKVVFQDQLHLQSPVHSLRDVRSIADSWNSTSVGSSDDDHSDEPEFMQQPVVRVNSANKPENLQARLKRMTSWERRQWLAEHWNSFQILKEDEVARQFHNRMQRFFCAEDDPTNPSRSIDHPTAVDDQLDETTICGRIDSSSNTPVKLALCRQRFILTWMSPVISFGPRERLCLESIFKWHPRACVVVLSRTMDSSPGRRILEPFTRSGYRLTAITPDIERLFTDTPASKWYQQLRDGTGDPGSINLMQNLSNGLRLAVLYKYGGVYLDTDVVVLKPFHGLRNAVGMQSHDGATGRWTRLNNAVLVFQRAHPVLLEFVREFAESFDGSRWGWNGPYLVSRVMEKVQLRLQAPLRTPTLSPSINGTSSPVSVLPLQAFYPVNWVDVVRFFRRPADARQCKWQVRELEWMRQGSYAIHLWNKKSNFLKVEKGSIMETLFKHSCLFCKLSRS